MNFVKNISIKYHVHENIFKIILNYVCLPVGVEQKSQEKQWHLTRRSKLQRNTLSEFIDVNNWITFVILRNKHEILFKMDIK